MGILLLPLHGALFFVSLAAHLLVLVAFLDALIEPKAGFIAADKQTKLFWLMALVISFLVIFVGVVAAIVYFVDVRPAVRLAGGGPGQPRPSSSDGPYGPTRR